jgi:hypothetical protein
MKNTIMAAVVATVFGISAANAEGLYVGAGGDWAQSNVQNSSATGGVNARVGTDINKYVAAEFDLTAGFASGNTPSNTGATFNALIGYPVELGVTKVKPYAVVGTGYDFSSASNIQTTPVYNYGAGMQVGLTTRTALDVRYTRVADYNSKAAANVVGVGIDYHF